MIPRWTSEEIQGSILCSWWQAKGRDWLIWDMGSGCAMVDCTNCHDFSNQTKFNIDTVWHHCCIHAWASPTNRDDICTPATWIPSRQRWRSAPPQSDSIRAKAIIQIFFKYLTERLVKQGLSTSNLDPCLFISKSLIVIIYADDKLIYGKSMKEIDHLMENLKQDDIDLHKEGTAEGYLGVDIHHQGGKLHFFK